MDILDLLVPSAYAQEAAAEPNAFVSLLPLIAIFIIFYFLMIRPQMKRAKEHRAMVAAINVGDEVVTNGGLVGKITKVEDSFVDLAITKEVVIQLQRHAVAALLPKGTVKR